MAQTTVLLDAAARFYQAWALLMCLLFLQFHFKKLQNYKIRLQN